MYQRDSSRGLRIVLCFGFKERPKANIISPLLFRNNSLFQRVRRNPGDRRTPQNFSSRSDWKIVLPEMHPIGTNSKG
jgi:hypothetical protein